VNGKQILGIVLVLLIGVAVGLYAKFGLETGLQAPPAPTQPTARTTTEDLRPGSRDVDAILRDAGKSGRQASETKPKVEAEEPPKLAAPPPKTEPAAPKVEPGSAGEQETASAPADAAPAAETPVAAKAGEEKSAAATPRPEKPEVENLKADTPAVPTFEMPPADSETPAKVLAERSSQEPPAATKEEPKTPARDTAALPDEKPVAKAAPEETTPAQTATEEKPAADQLAALPPERKLPQPKPPAFDVAEIGPDGGFVVAGRAAPGAHVRLLDGDGHVLAEGTADAEGAFAFLSERPLPEGDSLLRLEVAGPDGEWIPGAETIVVARAGGGAPLVALQTDDATQPTRVLQQPEPPPAPAAVEATPQPEPQSEEAIKSADKDLAVGTVDYDAAGRLSVKGTATPGAPVTVEVDGAPVAETKADAAGDWQATTPPGAAEGASRVGASSVSPEAESLRVSLPFAPASLIRDFPQGRLVVVQPGNSLWRIARRAYGSGFRYTVIYAANQDQIRNPDLIYPGQILHAPKPREG